TFRECNIIMNNADNHTIKRSISYFEEGGQISNIKTNIDSAPNISDVGREEFVEFFLFYCLHDI
ncbi:MAG: hypothetical protein AAF984_11110, partial [Verrucomicrobiota bacterium]